MITGNGSYTFSTKRSDVWKFYTQDSSNSVVCKVCEKTLLIMVAQVTCMTIWNDNIHMFISCLPKRLMVSRQLSLA